MLRRVVSLVSSMSRVERGTLLTFTLLFLGSLLGLLRLFYLQNTLLLPNVGGTYIEGSVGSLQPLNPWFTVENDVNRDIVSLIFAGLLKYNPQTRKVEEDLATLSVSKDGKVYTLALKPGLRWHDSTPSSPHFVTADDVLFTFKTIQDPAFPNTLLQQNFRGVRIEKIDDQLVRFILPEPYHFFSSNLTLGLLPRRSFEGIPVRKLNQALDFGFHPVGAGPYELRSIVQTDLSSEVTLERFERAIGTPYHLERVVFRIYVDYSTLLSDLRTLQGIRLAPRNRKGEPVIPRRFEAKQYVLPQYVALFFNLDRLPLRDDKLRLGLQLGTNKKEIAALAHDALIVDTPLLEIDVSDWRYQFDLEAAQGALFNSHWHLPEKVRLQEILEIHDANATGMLHLPAVVFLATGAVLTASGTVSDLSFQSRINGFPLQRDPEDTQRWIAALPTVGTGDVLRLGRNVLRVTDAKGSTVDSFYLHRARTTEEYRRALEEQRLMELFLKGRSGKLPQAERVQAEDLFLEEGYLRLRSPSDPVGVRRNDSGESLVLSLLTSPSPPEYSRIAELLQKQWGQLGVHITLDIPKTRAVFQEKLLKREYDILLFGQSLLDNLDSYPYWHSSSLQRLTGNTADLRRDAYNLSQYSSLQADTLLERIRKTGNEEERATLLSELRELLKDDVPAIFLYSPPYTFAHSQTIQGVELGSLSLHSDRFLTLHRWYVKQRRRFVPGRGWLSFFSWISRLGRK